MAAREAAAGPGREGGRSGRREGGRLAGSSRLFTFLKLCSGATSCSQLSKALAAADNFSSGTVKTPRARLGGALHPSRRLLLLPPQTQRPPPPAPPAAARLQQMRVKPTHRRARPLPGPRRAPRASRGPLEVAAPPQPRSLPSSAGGSEAAVHKLQIVRGFGQGGERGGGGRIGGEGGKSRRGDGGGGRGGKVARGEGGAGCKVAKLVFRILNSTFHMPLW